MSKILNLHPIVLILLLGVIGITAYELRRLIVWLFKEFIKKDKEGADKIIEGNSKWIAWAIAFFIFTVVIVILL